MAKRKGDDLPVKRATRMMTAVEAPPRRAQPIAKAPPRRDVQPVLQGEGPFASLSFPLNKARLVVGRVGPANILIDDDSVSRRHAEIVKTGSKFSVRDLDSSNGTFLNGDRITEADLQPGDVVRFGVVELTFTGPGGEKAAGPAKTGGGRGNMTKVGLGLAAVTVLAIAAAAIIKSGPPPEPASKPPPAITKDQEALKVLGLCQAYSDHESPEYDLEKCLKACNEAHALDETRGANRMAKRCEKEIENEALLESAGKLIGTGLEEEGLKDLLKIDRDTAVFPRAKAKFDVAVGILLKKYKSQCKGDVSGGWFETAYDESCRRVLELTCNRPEGPDPEALKWFQHAARQQRKGKGEYRCLPEAARYQNTVGPKIPDPMEAAEAAIRAKYPDPKIAQVMVGYFRDGSAKKASSALKNLRSQATPKERSLFTDLVLWLDLLDGKVTTAAGRIALKQAKEAEAILKEAFEADARILPPGLQSDLIRNAKADLARLYADMAKDACAKEHLESCYELARRGSDLNPKDTNLLNMLRRMERTASDRLNDSPGCESVGFARSVTGVDTPVHQKAVATGKELGCPPRTK
ncbi:MAG TPA: FHA domain-containing protein [Myxococcales bacterium]|jgi:hypothetical protein